VKAEKNLGLMIRRERIRLHIPQTLLARKLGRSQRWLSLVEQGAISVDDPKAERISAAISRISQEALSNISVDFSDLHFVARRARSRPERNKKSRNLFVSRPRKSDSKVALRQKDVVTNSEAILRIEEIAKGLRNGV
jgi:transcriptional regulator with XRE-family HTH domain